MTTDRHPELPLDPDLAPPAFSLIPLLLVAVGGTLGTLLRYEISLHGPQSASWPWPTLIANLLGCFVLGVLLESLARGGLDRGIRRRLRLLVGTGFCGGLTTYSTFATEADLLVHHHHYGLMVGYLAVSVTAGVVVAAVGVAVAAKGHRW